MSYCQTGPAIGSGPRHIHSVTCPKHGLGGTVTGAWACSCPTETPTARRLPSPMAGLPSFSTVTWLLLAGAAWFAYREYDKEMYSREFVDPYDIARAREMGRKYKPAREFWKRRKVR